MTIGAGAAAGAADVRRIYQPQARPGTAATVEAVVTVATAAVLRARAEAKEAAARTTTEGEPGTAATVEAVVAVAAAAVLRTQAEAKEAAAQTVMAVERAAATPGMVPTAVGVVLPTVETGAVLVAAEAAAEPTAVRRERGTAMEAKTRTDRGAERETCKPR
jgi:hypothetical protein